MRAQIGNQWIAGSNRQELLAHLSSQLELVQSRLSELTDLAGELGDKQRRVKQKIREIEAE